jgi:hypothetical protein
MLFSNTLEATSGLKFLELEQFGSIGIAVFFYGIAPNLDACLAKADEERDVGASWGTRYFFADGSALISDKWVLM